MNGEISGMGDFLLVTTVKNEGPNLLEWVAHHRRIGFTKIYVYQNDSTDETQKTLRTLQRIGAVEYFNNPSPKRQWQNKAYRRVSRTEDFLGADWCMALDGDEFLNVHVGDGTVQDLVAACPDADEILVNWRMMCGYPHTDLSDELVTARYVQTDLPERITDGRPMGHKSLFRPSVFRRPGIHRAKVPNVQRPRVYNGSGLEEGDFDIIGWRSLDPGMRKLAQVNHYSTRDLSSFLLKSLRGSSSHPDREVSLSYWQRNNVAETEDRSLASQANLTRAAMENLDRSSRGRLSFLRNNSLRLWQAELEAAMNSEPLQILRNSLLECFEESGKTRFSL